MKLRYYKYSFKNGITTFKTKLALTISAIALAVGGTVGASLLPSAASAASSYSISPWTFVGAAGECGTNYPAGTAGNVVSKWDYSVGNPTPSLYLQKSAATTDCSSAGATVNGVSGTKLTELNFDYLTLGHCGAGAPRYNVYTTSGVYYFFGCSYGTHTVNSNGWTHVQFTDADAVPSDGTTTWPGFGNVTVTGIDVVFDEGTDQGSGFAYLDNFSINGQVISGPQTPGSKDDCKGNGWKGMQDANGTLFKNQGDCVSYFATKGKNPANGAPATVTHGAVGNVTLSNPTQTLSFHVLDNGASASDAGFVTYHNADPSALGLTYTVPVTCVNASGNTAYYTYQIPSTAPVAANIWVIWKVVDNGATDTAGFTTASDMASANAVCEAGSAGVTNYTITAGDIKVF